MLPADTGIASTWNPDTLWDKEDTRQIRFGSWSKDEGGGGGGANPNDNENMWSF